MKNLARRRRERRPPLDAYHPGVLPQETHHALDSGAGGDGGQEGIGHDAGVDWSDLRAHQEAQSGSSTVAFVFHELVVGRPPAEARGQHLFENPTSPYSHRVSSSSRR
jgi:hypothetical protein